MFVHKSMAQINVFNKTNFYFFLRIFIVFFFKKKKNLHSY